MAAAGRFQLNSLLRSRTTPPIFAAQQYRITLDMGVGPRHAGDVYGLFMSL